MTEYQYMRSRVDEFLDDLRRESGAPEDTVLLKRFWLAASCGIIDSEFPAVREFLQRFHSGMGLWEKANILFGLVEDVNNAAIAAAKHYVELARRQDEEEARNEPDTDAGRDAQSALRAEQALEEVQGGR